ncbi:MAG: VCBS repeat-containing protein, partial [Desulfobulbaceae bacterium]|nr:VCBS repeat-containing protein [Desulfobulbaceae bacterium]
MTFPRLLLAVLLALTFAMPVQAGGKKIAILPFEVLAANDLAYLKEGVRVMLASRLAGGAGVAVVDRAAVDQALAGTAVP